MTNLIGIHLQQPTNDWTKAVEDLPVGSIVKVFQVQQGRKAKEHNPDVITVFRYHDDDNQFFDNRRKKLYVMAGYICLRI